MLIHSPQANLSVLVSRSDAVLFGVTGDARERVLAARLVIFFEGKPVNGPTSETRSVCEEISVCVLCN